MRLASLHPADARRGSAYPAAILAVFYAAGIALCRLRSTEPMLLLAGIALVLFLLPLAARKTGGWLIVAAGFLLAGALSGSSIPDGGPHALKSGFENGLLRSGDPVVLTGTMPDGYELRPDAISIDIDVSQIVVRGSRYETEGTVRLYVSLTAQWSASELEALRLSPGSAVSAAARLEREEPFGNPGGFRYLEYLDRQGLDAIGFVKSPLLIERTGEGSTSVTGHLSRLRNGLVNALISGLPQPAAGIAAASLTGNRHYLTRDSATAYREGGTFHILVVSGLHVTVAGGLCLWLLSGLGAGRRAKFLVPMIAVWGYSLVSGAGTPVLRAAVMFSFVAFASVFGRRASPINALGAAVLLLLTLDPDGLFDPSFQLTVLSVAGIACFALPVIDRLRAIGEWRPTITRPLPPRVPRLLQEVCELLYWNERAWQLRRKETIWSCGLVKVPMSRRIGGTLLQKAAALLFEGLTVSASIQLFLLPLQAVYFHRFAPAGIVLNLASGIYLFLFGVAVAVGQLCGLFSEALASAIAETISFGTDAWLAIQTSGTSLIPSIRVPVYSGAMRAVYLLHYVPLAYLVVLLLRWEPFASSGSKRRGLYLANVIVSACVSGIIVFHPFSAPAPDGHLTVTYLDVGQGDSAFVRFPDGRTMLIDGGGRRTFERSLSTDDPFAGRFEPDSRSIGESVVSEFLWESGYSKVDFLLLSHPDADHIGGLSNVVRNFRTGALLISDKGDAGEAQETLIDEARKKGVPVYRVPAGKATEVGGTMIEFLWPSEAFSMCSDSGNDLSLVVRISFGVRKFLFTGDIEECAEDLLSDSPDLIRADVVKIPHHGSRTSSTWRFVTGVSPEFAVVSAGRRSQFGHPHGEVVERWTAAGSRVLSTAGSGAITVTTDGSRLEAETFIRR